MFEAKKGVKRFSKKTTIIAVVVFVVLVLAGIFAWQLLKKDSGNAELAQRQASADRVLKEVGKIYVLPEKEDPTVAQVEDKNKLKGQTFFDNAKDGDYVILYRAAKLALLYREDIHKLINVGPISLSTEQSTGTSTGSSDTGTSDSSSSQKTPVRDQASSLGASTDSSSSSSQTTTKQKTTSSSDKKTE